jgi:hypothetical protein
MNNLVRSLAAFALVLAAYLPQPAFALDTGDIVVESVTGEVRVTMKGAVTAVRAGGVLELPATIDTGRAGAIELRQGATTISVGPETRLEFPALEKRGGPIDRVVQPRGNAFYNIGKRAGRRLRVETPYLVGVIKGTQFNVAAQDEATTISLFEGLLEVHASDDSSVVDLKAGEIASRKRGDKSISVIKMDSKAPPTQRAPGSPSGSTGGTPTPSASEPARVVGIDPVFVERGGTAGVSTAGSSIVEGVRAPADVSVAVDLPGSEPGASVATGVNLSAGGIDVDAAADVAVSKGVDVGAGAAVNLGSTAVEVATGVNLDSGGVDATVNAGVNLGGAVEAGVDAAVNVGGGAVDVGASVNVDAGPVAVDVGAATNVDLGAGAVEVGANVAVDAGPLTTDVNAGAAVDVSPGNVAANVDLGTNVDLGNVAIVNSGVGADVSVGTNVAVAANVDVSANVAGVGAGVNAGVDVAAGNVDLGVNVAGVDLNVGVNLGLGSTTATDTTTTTETPTTPVIDVGGLLDGLLRRPGKK